MPELAYVNGEWVPIAEACVPIDDRGFQFGDGVYEVIRTYEGRLWALDRHLRRLEYSLAAIGLAGVSIPEIRDLVLELFARGGIADCSVYVQITRGVQPRRHTYDHGNRPTVVMTLRPHHPPDAALYAGGVGVLTVPEIRWARRDIKSTNLLGNILAKQRAYEAGAYEAVFYEADGRVTEGASTNIFILRRGRVVTHPKDHHILAGITRDLVIETARETGLPVEERPFTRDELLAPDEAFLTGTSTEVMGVVKIDDTRVANGRVGECTRALLAAFHKRVEQQRDA